VAKFAAVPSFATDTAEKTGAAERTVQLHAERGEKIAPHHASVMHATAITETLSANAP
jgi:hypothetical protein